MSPVSVRSLLYKDYIWSRIDWPWTCFMTMVLSGDLGSQMKLVTITGGDVCLCWVLWACPPAKRALLALVSPQYPISPFPMELLFSSCSSAFLESWAKQGGAWLSRHAGSYASRHPTSPLLSFKPCRRLWSAHRGRPQPCRLLFL